MKHIRKIIVLVLVAALALSLSGCSNKMTAKKLIKNIVEASAQNKITEGTTAMEMDMAFSANGGDFVISMAMILETKTSYDPYCAYSKMETAMDMNGTLMTEAVETYNVVEEGKVVSYVHNPNNGQWGKQESGVSVDAIVSQESDYAWMAEKPASEFDLSEHEHTLDGKPVYVLSCTLTGDQLNTAMSGLGGLEDMFSGAGMGNANLGDIRIPTTFYIDTESYMPVKVEMDVNGLGDVLSASMADSLGDGMTIKITKVAAVFDGIGYGAVEVPQVPEDVLNMNQDAAE